jgi:ATP-binding cassette subfamily C protein
MKINKLWNYIYYVVAPVSVLISTLFAMSLQPIIDNGMSGDKDGFLTAGICAIIFCLLDVIFAGITNVLENHVKASFIANFRLHIFDKLFGLKISEFNDRASADFMTDLTTRPEDLSEKLCANKLNIYKSVWSLLISVVAIVSTRWELAIYVVVFSLISVYLPKVFQSKSIQYENEYVKTTDVHTRKSQELIRNFGIVKIFGIVKEQRKKYLDVIHNVKKADIDRNNKTNTLNTISIGISELSFTCIIIFSTLLVLKGKLSVGYILSISQLLGGIMYPFEVLPGYIMEYKNGKKIYKQIMGSYEFSSKAPQISINDCSSIKLENVSVKKENTVLIDHINLGLDLSKKYAVIGKSGAGKSTLVKTIMKFIDADEGNITYDDHGIDEFDEESIFHFISYQNQKLSMLDESIKDNIVLFKDYDVSQWNSVIKEAALSEFIDKKEQRENTLLHDDAKNISGGELQRIAIARSLYSSAKFMIFDECLANLDNPTAMQIERDLLLNSQKGLLMITHRVFEENMKLYDYVILMDKGKIIEINDWSHMQHK